MRGRKVISQAETCHLSHDEQFRPPSRGGGVGRHVLGRGNRPAFLDLLWIPFFCLSHVHLLCQLILEAFPADRSSFCMLSEERRSELAITFLHYNILTSWRCKESAERRQGDAFSQEPPRGAVEGAKQGLIKVLLDCFTAVRCCLLLGAQTPISV